jgi:cellulose biosynthesis protein BcsQ
MSKNVFVAIANQKGGVGKTTTTALVAAAINQFTDYKVCVVDIDPQGSILTHRKNEMAELEKGMGCDPVLRRGVQNLLKKDKDFYLIMEHDVLPSSMDNQDKLDEYVDQILGKIESLRTGGEFDIVFFDFPGFTAHESFIRLLGAMDYVITPFYPDPNTKTSTVEFVTSIQEAKKLGISKVKRLGGFMWKYTGAKNVEAFHNLAMDLVQNHDLWMFQNKVYDTVDYQKYSTLYSVDVKGERSLLPFVSEILEFVGLNNNENKK